MARNAQYLLKDDLLALPGVAAAGVSREMVSAAVAGKGAVPAPVPNQAWWLDAIQIGVGIGLRAVDYIWGVPAVGSLGRGVLDPGLAYGIEDATHALLRMTKEKSSAGSGTQTSQRVQVRVLPSSATAAATPTRTAARLSEDF